MCGSPRCQHATLCNAAMHNTCQRLADYLIDKNSGFAGFAGTGQRRRLAYLMSRAMPLTVKAKATVRRKASSLMPW